MPSVLGRRIGSTVSLVDVAPTLLELAGLPVPEGLDGSSLAGALLREEAPPDRTLFAEAYSPRRWIGTWEAEAWNPPLVAVRAGKAKYIVHRPEHGAAHPPRHFDLAIDPLEQSPRPLAASERRTVEAQVDDYLRGRFPAPGAAPPGEALTPDEQQRLRSLGYAD